MIRNYLFLKIIRRQKVKAFGVPERNSFVLGQSGNVGRFCPKNILYNFGTFEPEAYKTSYLMYNKVLMSYEFFINCIFGSQSTVHY